MAEPFYWLRAFTAKPYPPREALGLVRRNLLGAARDNPAGLRYAPRHFALNAITPRLTLGFGGDVMSMFDRPLSFATPVAQFFKSCDHVLLNFEGVITDQRQISPDQKHTRPILDAITQLAPRERLVLSLANNHTGDFGEDACRRCVDLLKAEGFTSFGLAENPVIDLGDHLRLVTGTRWSNRHGAHLAWLEDPARHVRPGGINVLYPHWGYELELFPRAMLVAQMRQWLRSFDAVVGHHSHTPQPLGVERNDQGVARLAAYSLGDLCFGMAWRNLPTFKYYAFGMVARATMGPLVHDPAQWALGEVDWSFVECCFLGRGRGFEVRLVDEVPFIPPSARPQVSRTAG